MVRGWESARIFVSTMSRVKHIIIKESYNNMYARSKIKRRTTYWTLSRGPCRTRTLSLSSCFLLFRINPHFRYEFFLSHATYKQNSSIYNYIPFFFIFMMRLKIYVSYDETCKISKVSLFFLYFFNLEYTRKNQRRRVPSEENQRRRKRAFCFFFGRMPRFTV